MEIQQPHKVWQQEGHENAHAGMSLTHFEVLGKSESFEITDAH